MRDDADKIVVRMPSDGNCLFRALAYPNAHHRHIRRDVVRHLRENWRSTYHGFVPDTDQKTYLAQLGLDGTWGDELVIRAYSILTGDHVRIYNAHAPHTLLCEYGGGDEDRRCHHLLFDGCHYDVLALAPLVTAPSRRQEWCQV